MKTTVGRIAAVVLSMLLCALGLLCVVYSPAWAGWRPVVFATQYGHLLALLAAGSAALAMWRWRVRPSGASRAAALLSVIAFGLLFTPAIRACRLSGGLAAGMQAAFGPATATASHAPPFSWLTLYRFPPADVVRTETHEFARDTDYRLELSVVRPPHSLDANRRLPAIVLVHGGGWDGGNRDELPEFTRWLVSQDFVVFAIDYRLAPRWKWPAPRDDVGAALRWVRDQAAQFDVDPERILLFGRSAGAQIALAAAYDPASPRVRGVVAFYGPADMTFAYRYGREDDVLKSPALLRAYIGGTPDERPADYLAASPFEHVRADVPPTLLVHGELDTLVWDRQSERLDARLAEFGAPHYLLLIPGATHALEYNLNSPSGQLARWAVQRFLARVTATAP